MKHITNYPINILMLDIDGVINILPRGKGPFRISQRSVNAVNRIMRETKSKLVISSTWRIYQFAKLEWQLSEWGIKGPIFGMTPDYSNLYRGIFLTVSRTQEIAHWLADCPQPIGSLIILDDDPIVGYLAGHHVQTLDNSGVTPACVEKALEIAKMPFNQRLLNVTPLISDMPLPHSA